MAYSFTGAPKGPINAPKPSADIPISKGELSRKKNKGNHRRKKDEPIAPTPRYEAKVRREREEEIKKQRLLKEQQNAQVAEVSEATDTTEAVAS